jgi:hypothetical protein
MRRFALAAVAALSLAVAGPRPAGALPFTNAFEELQVELENRAEDLDGTTDTEGKKRLKVLLKCLTLLGKESASAYEDMKTFAAITKQLGKVYPEDAAVTSSTTLAQAQFAALDDLYTQYVGVSGPFEDTTGKMVPGARRKKATKLLLAIDKATNTIGPESTFAEAGKGYLKAWKSAIKGAALVEGAELLPAPDADVTFNGLALSTSTVFATDAETGDTHNLTLNLQIPEDGLEMGILGGIYLKQPNGGSEEYSDFSGGTCTATTLDLAGNVFEGSIDLTMIGFMDIPVTGSFSATWYLETVKD